MQSRERGDNLEQTQVKASAHGEALLHLHCEKAWVTLALQKLEQPRAQGGERAPCSVRNATYFLPFCLALESGSPAGPKLLST